ncbi:MAG: FecR domain-containing protein, partial [Gemmatimonadaceae bacterium]|nr:FecR domain-containing protein [Gemmatimonadaceae bacterium]
MTDEEMWRLLVGHSRDQLTVADAARLRAWVDADATRQEMVRGVEAIVAASRERPADTDADASWAAVRARIVQRDAGAASVERRVAHPWRRAGAIAAAVLVAAGAIVGGRVLWLAQRAAAPLQEYRTARGERVAVVLTDGTRITLGAASRLYAPERFGRTRTVFLEGQAFFEVAHDTAHPFIVRAGDAAARAVGTAFAVRRYPDDSVVRVVVTEGRVQLGAQGAPAGSGA